jgi:hypothetical protein
LQTIGWRMPSRFCDRWLMLCWTVKAKNHTAAGFPDHLLRQTLELLKQIHPDWLDGWFSSGAT